MLFKVIWGVSTKERHTVPNASLIKREQAPHVPSLSLSLSLSLASFSPLYGLSFFPSLSLSLPLSISLSLSLSLSFSLSLSRLRRR